MESNTLKDREMTVKNEDAGTQGSSTKRSKCPVNESLEGKEEVNISRFNGKKLPKLGKRHKSTDC